MVFSSLPLFLDPPNWQQHPNQHQHLQGQNNHHDHQNQHHVIPPLHQTPQPQPPHQVGIGGGGLMAQQIRPNSMAEQARQRQIQPPETPLKCPRCASTNTKFCYYNNYNLSQPRHMCKSCCRYWTQGGVLRNVPVGGGCRKNKRTTSSSKPTSSSSSKPITMVNNRNLNLNRNPNPNPSLGGNSMTPMSFMTSLENTGPQFGGMTSMGLTFSSGPIHTPLASITNPPEGISGGLERGGHLNSEFPHHVQFPNFLGGFEIPSSFQNVHDNNQRNGDGYEDNGNSQEEQRMRNDMSKSSSRSMVSQVKMENNQMMIMGVSSSTNTNTNTNQFINWDGDNNNNVTNNYYHVDSS